MSALPRDAWPGLARLMQVVGMMLGRDGKLPAAIAHIDLAEAMGPEDDPTIGQLRQALEGDPVVAPWLKNPYELAEAPASLSEDHRARFDQAAEWAHLGLWQSAAAGFEVLSASVGGAEVERNLGLCRLWMADEVGAVEALRRSAGWAGPTADAVDLEALCQQIAPPGRDDLVEQVHLIFPLRDRDRLLSTLRARPEVVEEGRAPLDADDPNSFEVDQFALLDRPRLAEGTVPAQVSEVPTVAARVLVATEIVLLEAFDLGKLDGLGDRFRELAVPAIPPAHPKMKTIQRVRRWDLAMQPDRVFPQGIPRADKARLLREDRERAIFEVWPKTPMSYLGGRTPEQAARAGDAPIPLRAAVCQFESSNSFLPQPFDFRSLRERLGIGEEPEIDPAMVDLLEVHLGRLFRIPAERLDDEKLVTLYHRARGALLPQAMQNAARALVDRPSMTDRPEFDRFTIYSDLANLATSRDDLPTAHDWIARGRAEEAPARRVANAPLWDMLEVRIRSRSEAPETWVPHLAIVLDRYHKDEAANQAIMGNLLDMGLIRVVPNPDNPEDMLLDSRGLQAVLQEYGPKVTTASGGLGVSAAKGAIWTPGGPSGGGGGGGGGGLWTPGGGTPAAGGEKPKLIIPGR